MLKTPRLSIIQVCLIWIFVLVLPGCTAIDAGKELVSNFMMGGEDNTDPPSPLLQYEPELEVDRLWKVTTGAGADEQLLQLGIAVSYGKILTASHDGIFIARDVASGETVWEAETDYEFSAGPGVGIDTAIMGTSNAEVVAFNIDSGEQKWVARVSSEILAAPVIAKGNVIVRTIDGRVTVLNENDGALKWEFERSVPALSLRGTGSAIVVEDNVIAGYANGKLAALRLSDGKIIWETSIAIPAGRSEVERLVDLDVDPVETDGVIYVASYHGGISAVLEVDGDILWRNEDVSSYSGISYDWRYLYVSDSQSDVLQLDQRNGRALWKQDELRFRRLTTPVAYDDFVVMGDFEGYVHWLSIHDGRQLGRVRPCESSIDVKPVVVDNVVYVYCKDGTLAAYKAKQK